jgi:hypothetical protein
MPIASPIRFGALQAGLVAAFQEACGPNITVGWAYGESVYDSSNYPNKGDLINLTLTDGPTYSNRFGAAGTAYLPPSSILITITASQGMYVLEVNNQSFRFEASNSSTVNNIRDGLLASIAAALDPLSFTAAATLTQGQILLTPTFLGGVYQCSVISPGGNNMVGVPTISPNAVLLTSSSRLFTVTVQAFSKNKSPRNGAWDIISKCEALLEDSTYTTTFNDRGFTIMGKGTAVDLSNVDNGHWQSRVQFPFTVNMRSAYVRPIDQISTVNIQVDGVAPSTNVIFSVSR